MATLRLVTLLASTVVMGMMAGVFALYAHTIMPGLGRTDDRTFVGAFQAVDRAIVNPWFLLGGFGGALVLSGAAGLLHVGGGWTGALPWIVAAVVLYVAVVVITARVHLPLNDAIKTAGDLDAIDVAAVRARFDEARWAAWNLVRTVACVLATGCLAWALVQTGAG